MDDPKDAEIARHIGDRDDAPIAGRLATAADYMAEIARLRAALEDAAAELQQATVHTNCRACQWAAARARRALEPQP